MEITGGGTSLSASLVADVAFMYEYSDTKFTYEKMLYFFTKTEERNIIDNFPEGAPNVFINNGKFSIFR